MRLRRLILILVLLFSGYVQAQQESELIVIGQGFGPYRAELGEEGLQKTVDEAEIGFGDRGIDLFFMQPERRVAVVIDAGRVREMMIHGTDSVWHTPEGITLGSTLADLEAANGKPFRFHLFEGEESGAVTDWQGGRLQGLECIFASPFRAAGYDALSEAEKLALEKPGALSSDDAVARKLNPVVETLGLTFP